MRALEVFRRNTVSLLARLNLKYADLAKKTHIPASAISVYLSGKKVPNVETCEKIAAAFGLSLADMIREDGVPEPQEEMIPLSEHLRKVNELLEGFEGVRDTLRQGNNMIEKQTHELEYLRKRPFTLAEGGPSSLRTLIEKLSLLDSEARSKLVESWIIQLDILKPPFSKF